MTERIQNKNQNKGTTNLVSYFSVKTFNIVLICLLVLTGFLYLTQVNASAVKGYIIRDLETKLEDTKLANKKLELQSQAMQSVGGIAAKVEALGMVSVDKVEYLQAPGREVAVAK
jgi:hypothetical protein